MQSFVCVLLVLVTMSNGQNLIRIGNLGNLLAGGVGQQIGGPAIIGHDLHTTITRHIGVPIAQPFAFPVERRVPIPFRVAVAIPVDRPVAVPVPRQFPVPVDRPFAVAVDRPVPVAVPSPVAVPFIRQVGVPIPQPFPVGVQAPLQISGAQRFSLPVSSLRGAASNFLISPLGNVQSGLPIGQQISINTI